MARAGQKLRLECAVRALPHPELTWLHNNKPVRDNVDAKVGDGRGGGGGGGDSRHC